MAIGHMSRNHVAVKVTMPSHKFLQKLIELDAHCYEPSKTETDPAKKLELLQKAKEKLAEAFAILDDRIEKAREIAGQ